MLCRALLTAIAISYLICVLVLSGMQREDLDLNLLKKLQRHNVITDDLNNEKTRNECSTRRSLENNSKDGNDVTHDRNSSTTEPSLRTHNNSDKVKDLIATLDDTDVATTAIKYFKETIQTHTVKPETVFHYNDTVIVINPTQNPQNYEIKGSSYKTDKNDKTTRISTNAARKSAVIENHEGQPKLESVMKFWEMYMKITTNLVTTELPKSFTSSMIHLEYNPTKQNIQTSEGHKQIEDYSDTTVTTTDMDDVDSKEVERLSKIVAAYVSKKQTHQTQPLIRKRKKKLNTVVQQIEKFLAKKSQEIDRQSNDFTNSEAKDDTTDPVASYKNLINSPSPDNSYFNNNPWRKDDIINMLFQTKGRVNSKDESDSNLINKQLDSNTQFGSSNIFNNGEEISKYRNRYKKNLPYIPSNDSSYFYNSFKTNVDDIIRRYNRQEESINPTKNEYYANVNNNPYTILRRQDSSTNQNEQQYEAYNMQVTTPSEKYYSKLRHEVTKKPEKVPDINNDAMKHLSPDMLKQIAETVKEIVLKDLRKEIISTTTTSTTVVKTTLNSTTEATTIVPQTPDKLQQRATKAIENFIKLLERFKPVEEKLEVTPPNVKHKMNEKAVQLQAYSVPVNAMYHQSLTPETGQQINVIPYAPVAMSMNAPEPFDTVNRNTINTVTPMQRLVDKRTDRVRPTPVLIQTHSGMVPPLRIPISQPIPFSHNIVLTTQFPPSMTKYERDRWNYIFRYGRNPDTRDDIRNIKNRLNEYSNVKPVTYEYPTDSNQLAVIRERMRHMEMMKMNEYTERYEREPPYYKTQMKMNEYTGRHEREPPHYKTQMKMNEYTGRHEREPPFYKTQMKMNEYTEGYEREPAHYKAQTEASIDRIYNDIRGYHEKLEGMVSQSTDPWKNEHKVRGSHNPKLIEIGSRQILPMSSLKIGPKHDDTHFKEFMKTQRKVNDMLESILATRPKQYGTRSVEIT